MLKFSMGSEKSIKCFIYVILLFPCNFLEKKYRYFTNVYIERLFNYVESWRRYKATYRIHFSFSGSTHLCGCCWASRSVSNKHLLSNNYVLGAVPGADVQSPIWKEGASHVTQAKNVTCSKIISGASKEAELFRKGMRGVAGKGLSRRHHWGHAWVDQRRADCASRPSGTAFVRASFGGSLFQSGDLT